MEKHFASSGIVGTESPQRLLKFPPLSNGIQYAVNAIHLTAEQVKLGLRERFWYLFLNKMLVFENAVTMNAYIEKNGISVKMIALDTMEVANANGIQVGGESPKPHCLLGSIPIDDREDYKQVTSDLHHCTIIYYFTDC